MFTPLTEFLKRFTFTAPRQERHKVVAAISEATGIAISDAQVNCRNGTAYLSVPPVVRGEIFLKKRAVLERLADSSVRDIR